MTHEYSLTDMIKKIEEYFSTEGYEPLGYDPGLFYNVRLPIYCVKWRLRDSGEKEIEDEIVIDIITESHISKDTYMPDKEFEGCMVLNASSVKFFQHYLPRAKVFWAYGYYVNQEEDDFKNFKQVCSKNGIGLLEVSDNGVHVKLEPMSLSDITIKRLEEGFGKAKRNKKAFLAASKIITEHEDEYIRYLVYFGEPRFTRRVITEREDDSSRFLSMLLVNKLTNVKNIVYAEDLKNFTNEYRYFKDNDHGVAFKLIDQLWDKRFGFTYPDIQKDFEVVLLLNPKYRDHFLHQFQVFLLGIIIIDALYDEVWVKDFERNSGSKIEDAWLACSAYHDYNYPIQQWDDWITKFLSRNFHANGTSGERHINQEDLKRQIIQLNLAEIAVRDEFVDKLSRLVEGIGYSLDDCFQRFFIRRIAFDKNHATLGAFTFLEKFQNCRSLSIYAVNSAAVSILLHDDTNWLCLQGNETGLCECIRKDLSLEEREICNKKLLAHLSLNSMPLAFLLAFCDVAQEWGRQGRGFEINEPRLENVEVDSSKIHIHISVSNSISCKNKEEEVERLGHYLQDNRFEIRVSSRDESRDNTMKMSGN